MRFPPITLRQLLRIPLPELQPLELHAHTMILIRNESCGTHCQHGTTLARWLDHTM